MRSNLIYFLIGITLGFLFFFPINFLQKRLEDFLFAQIGKPFEEISYATLPKKEKLPLPDLNAKAALSLKVFPSGKEKILFDKNSKEKLPIASLTKLMTATIVLEDEHYDLEKTLIFISKEAANQGNVPHYGNLDNAIGQSFSVKELLELMLIYSSNDAAFALSEVIGPEKFVEKMNQKAKELGLETTHFVNPTGLDESTKESNTFNSLNYSSARDLAKLAEYILAKHPLIFEISSKKNIYPIENGISNLMIPEGFRLIGGKTGYTQQAGGSILVVLQDEKNRTYINIILGANSEKERIKEMQKLINWIANIPFQEENEKDIDLKKLEWKEVLLSAPWEKRDSHEVFVFQNKIWLIGGLNGEGQVIQPGTVDYLHAKHFSDIWVSKDGINWELITDKAPWGERRSIQVAIFKDKIFLIPGWGPKTGLKNEIWVSSDGINWELLNSHPNFPEREGHQLVVFKDKLWLIGGVNYDKREEKNDVWYSEDGKEWVQILSHAPWAARWDHTVTVFKDKLWLIGGMDLKGNVFGDVWVSEDGINWTLVTDHPPWKPRQGHGAVVFKEKLWLVGRFNDQSQGNGENDVWFSEDGINWEKTEKDPPWSGREDHGVIVFDDKIWVLGGMTKDWTWANDIWCSTFSP